MKWVFDQVRIIYNEMMTALPRNEMPSYERMIQDWGEHSFQEVINKGYYDDAYDMCQNYNIEIPDLVV